ncbi:MAG: uracil-DNA glycosylase family protein [Methanosarcinales archaeon]|jgi:uracil-DNA glycosylase|nr:uracil-DNA glycosylase family protein [Methanosarcinales archaeon]
MTVDMKQYLGDFIKANGLLKNETPVLPDCTVNPEAIKVMMINEVSPKIPADDFYAEGAPDYMTTTKMLFKSAGIEIANGSDLLALGIYVTNAVKTPKTEYTIETETILEHAVVLEKEFDLFPNLKAVMLMGDVAKKSFNAIAKKKTKKAVIPTGSTYKLRVEKFYYGDIRVFPSYIMTGGNILIEKSKAAMIAEDLIEMKALL